MSANFRLVGVNAAQAGGGQVPAGMPIAAQLYSDAIGPNGKPARHAGEVVTAGRIDFELDGPDPANRTGVWVYVQAAKGCAEWGPKHGLLDGGEVVFDDGSTGVQLEAGTNPFA